MVFSEKRVNPLIESYQPVREEIETFIDENIILSGEYATPYYKNGKMMPELWHVEDPRIITPVKNLEHLSGLTVSLVSKWAYNYFHWVCECLTMLCSLDFDKIDRIIIPNKKIPRVMESLEILGLSDKVMVWKGNKVVVDLYHTGPQRPNGYPKVKGLENLRRLYNVKATGNKKVYISRKDAVGRRVINERNLWKKLPDFEFITLRGVSFSQQIDYFSGVGEIIAPHGAGVTNLIWTEQAKVTELFGSYHHTCYAFMAKSLNMPYKSISLKPSGSDMVYNGEDVR